jgi:hypothetical protein
MGNAQHLLGPNGLMSRVEDPNGYINIFWAGYLFHRFHKDDSFKKRLGIAFLDNLGVVQKTICEFFNINRHTISEIAKVFQRDGIEGLQNYKQGPPEVDYELKQYVIRRYVELEGQRGYQRIILAEVAEKLKKGEWKRGIKRAMLQRILQEYRQKREEERAKNREEREAEEKAREERQKLRKDKEEHKSAKEEEVGNEGGELDFTAAGKSGEERCVEHGGAAAAIVYLERFGLVKEWLGENGIDEGTLYSSSELAVSYAALNAAGVVKVEQQFKLLPSYQMGGIIGRVRIPSLSVYRERIPQIVEGLEMKEVIYQSAKRMNEVIGFSRDAYIDGHFMPYYGGSRILYAYCCQRRLAMHGREYYYVQDGNGEPIYATISDGYREMKHYIEDVHEKLKGIYGVGDREFLEVFDRGGYSREFCVGIARKIRFVCWRSDAKYVPENAKWQKVVVGHQGNGWGEVNEVELQAWEREGKFKIGEQEEVFREVWIRKGNKVSPALTNDFRLGLEEVVRKLTRRWGAQENMFKELKEHGIDKIHSYDTDEIDEEYVYENGLEDEEEGIQREVDNPKVKELTEELGKERGEQRKLAVRLVEESKKEQGESRKVEGLKQRYTEIEQRIGRLIEEREGLPKKVLLMDIIEIEKRCRLCDGKKLFFDWLKMNAIWAKKRIRGIVAPHYQDMRDINKFVTSILRSRTYVRRLGDVLRVDFPNPHGKRKRMALEVFCKELNQTKEITMGLKFKRLVFGVRGID